jgi:hypothetical protein
VRAYIVSYDVRETTAHAEHLLDDERLRALYQHSLRDGLTGRRSECPSIRELTALVYDATPRSRRIDLVRHVARCLSCAGDLNRLRAGEYAAREACVGEAATMNARIHGEIERISCPMRERRR